MFKTGYKQDRVGIRLLVGIKNAECASAGRKKAKSNRQSSEAV